MDDNSKTNGKKVRRISAKEKVLKLYPNTELRRFGKAYVITLDDDSCLGLDGECWLFFEKFKTERQAWNQVWREINEKMLEKLED